MNDTILYPSNKNIDQPNGIIETMEDYIKDLKTENTIKLIVTNNFHNSTALQMVSWYNTS